MYLNTISSAPGSRKTRRRVGRGIGSGLGKTCGRGHKGQKSRAGGYHKLGFEGGQMPLQRRLPKSGFASLTSRYVDEVRLHELNLLTDSIVSLDTLRRHGLINQSIVRVKIIASGEITKALVCQGVQVTRGARAAIEAAGGKVEE